MHLSVVGLFRFRFSNIILYIDTHIHTDKKDAYLYETLPNLSLSRLCFETNVTGNLVLGFLNMIYALLHYHQLDWQNMKAFYSPS